MPDNTSNRQFTNGLYPEMVWLTTGPSAGRDIEIINADADASQSNYGENEAAEGEQYAEINCEAAGALYQDVLTMPGQELYWWASHQARNQDELDEGDWNYDEDEARNIKIRCTW